MGKKRSRPSHLEGGRGPPQHMKEGSSVMRADASGHAKKKKKRRIAMFDDDAQSSTQQGQKTGEPVAALTKAQLKRRRRKERQKRSAAAAAATAASGSESSDVPASQGPPEAKGLSALQSKFKAKLDGARFRMLNEMLYTSTGAQAYRAFRDEPELFDVYHQGFREQVSKWPRNPLDAIVAWVRQRPTAVVADFGCGEARLAASVSNKVHSFDLVAANERVMACDVAHVPLPDASVDVVVLCLSLMGTDMMKFITEAVRVLKDGGIIKVAEVRSRFEGCDGGIEKFQQACQAQGLECRQLDRSNQMFFMMEFVKHKTRTKKTRGGAKGHQISGSADPLRLPTADPSVRKQKAVDSSGAAGRKKPRKAVGAEGVRGEVEGDRTGADAGDLMTFSAKACVYKKR